MLADGVDGIVVATVDVVDPVMIDTDDDVELALMTDNGRDVGEGGCIVVGVVVDAVVVVVVVVLDTERVYSI